VLSGPAGGAAHLVREGNLISFEMGGTSTDISLIIEGRPNLASNRRVGGHAIALGSLDIGAGSRSIARVDRGGFLNVGPASAGAATGPACYGDGGNCRDRY
jgi:N-methylhydantoinase A